MVTSCVAQVEDRPVQDSSEIVQLREQIGDFMTALERAEIDDSQGKGKFNQNVRSQAQPEKT